MEILSKGALCIIMKGEHVESPIMQVLEIKKVAENNSDIYRYCTLVSDGQYFSFARFIRQINDQIEYGELNRFCIIKIKKYSLFNLENMTKPILVIHEIGIIVSGHKVCKRIGSPISLPEDVLQIRPNNVNNNSELNSPSTSATSSTFQPLPQQKFLIYSIANLNPYQNKWVIKARITSKSNVRNWSKSHRNGKVFSMHLLDATGEIHVTVYDDLIDKFYNYLEVDKVYYISMCAVKPTGNPYCNLKHECEMLLTTDTVIELCDDDVDNIPEIQYDFITIDKIINIEVGNFIDVVGICKSMTDLQTIQSRSTDKEFKKREITLVDQTNNGISLVLWNSDAEIFNVAFSPVIALRGVRVAEFRGSKHLSMSNCSVMKVNPTIFEAAGLCTWYESYGIYSQITNLSARPKQNIQLPWVNFRGVKNLYTRDFVRREYFQVHGTVLLFRAENMLYQACSNELCNRKLVHLENGIFKCEKCCTESPNFKYRLFAQALVGDCFDNHWLYMFSLEVEKLTGMTAAEVGQAAENDRAVLAEIANKNIFKRFIFKCQARFEIYNDENRMKVVAVDIEPINYREYNSYLIQNIYNYLRENSFI